VLPEDRSFPIQEEGARNPDEPEEIVDALSGIEPDGVRHAELSREALNFLLVSGRVHTDTDHGQPAIDKGAVNLLEGGNLLTTGLAPGSPYIEQDHVAAQLRERHGISHQRGRAVIWSRLSHAPRSGLHIASCCPEQEKDCEDPSSVTAPHRSSPK
jgi:hypothetical protein